MKGVIEMYHVNDTILYGMQGVCRIVEIIKRNFGRRLKAAAAPVPKDF